jgi:hypothetical protein
MRGNTSLSFNSWRTRARCSYEYALILRNYWRLRSAAELFQVFPDSRWAVKPHDVLVRFYLAQIANERPSLHHRQFAVDSMFEIGGDLQAMELAAELFGFSHAAYREFMAHNPLGMQAERRLSWRLKQLAASRMTPGLLMRLRRWKRYLQGAATFDQ